MIRFLHSSDLHIGKRFGNMPEDLRGRLREARHAAIGRLAAQGRDQGAQYILLAGDTFDTETPTPAMLRQALSEMNVHADMRWILLPGNHDSLLADELWATARGALPDNVVLALKPEPIMLGETCALLPAPCTTRRPGRDLTEWMGAAATPEGVLRVGLAHGPIQAFCEDGGDGHIIAPERAQRAGLDYLALGDWHGQIRVNEATWYSGTPEPDRFKHGAPGQALVVSLEAPGAAPDVVPVETAAFDWRTTELAFLGGEDPSNVLERALPAATARRQTLLRRVATGRMKIGELTALRRAFETAEPDFGHAVLDTEQLAAECEISDLDGIDRSGALRQAAEALLAESNDADRAADERDIARDALARLFSYCEAAEQ